MSDDGRFNVGSAVAAVLVAVLAVITYGIVLPLLFGVAP